MRIGLGREAVAAMPSHDVPREANGGRMAYRIADSFALLVALGLAGAILANVFMNQTGAVMPAADGKLIPLVEKPKATPAPAPLPPGTAAMFNPNSLSTSVPQGTVLNGGAATAGTARPTVPAGVPVPPASVPAKTPVPLIADIQRELARRGFYDGPADGLTGPRTDAAIRAFEQAARLKVTGEPSDALLAQIRRSPVAASAAAQDATGSVRPPADVPGSNRILAVQKTLAKLGYGPIKMDGKPGTETRLAIQRFERDRNLPASGEITDRLVRELSAVSGMPIE
ncbi:peptidoglycan-binding domain-containing protein [Aquabacter sediminis]|uniref:peptidoglycan-binding domain-containing protein n=1 Tax=Aquabacter sediminis TaxID=3029197 RepID=UPI00237EB40F|nr:peptidoglycan-binding domain-containing protein [Aquabacter sp. P-9]MDE1568495.1 peptidoglycan-binding domain-containing protein [Aquabacter sp. P-9]